MWDAGGGRQGRFVCEGGDERVLEFVCVRVVYRRLHCFLGDRTRGYGVGLGGGGRGLSWCDLQVG